jgi:hypothetical protein
MLEAERLLRHLGLQGHAYLYGQNPRRGPPRREKTGKGGRNAVA